MPKLPDLSPLSSPPGLPALAVRWLLYPALALATLAYLAHALGGPPGTLGRHYGAYLAAMVGVLALVESRYALRDDWRMTRPRFLRRDLPFLLLGAATLGATQWAATWLATQLALTRGQALAHWPLLPAVGVSLLLTDGLWYAVHRYSHESRSRLGQFLWRVHVAHHLPQQVYVLMHAIGHPLNAVLVRALLALPPCWLGFAPEAVFVAGVVTGFQGLVSHFNVDSRVGPLNHLLVGTELHRHHHSADPAEAGNYGAVLSVWDQLFGTFVYRPGAAPAALGVADPQAHPRDTQIAAVLREPWRPLSRNWTN